MSLSAKETLETVTKACHPVVFFNQTTTKTAKQYMLPLMALHQRLFAASSTTGVFKTVPANVCILQMQHAGLIESVCGLPLQKGDLNCELNTTGFTPFAASAPPIREIACNHNERCVNRNALAVPVIAKVFYMPNGNEKDEYLTKMDREIQQCRYAKSKKQKRVWYLKKTITKLKAATASVKSAAAKIGEIAKVLPKNRVVKIARVRKGRKSMGSSGDNRHFEKKAPLHLHHYPGS